MRIQIGANIKQLRARDGRTQEMLADAIGVTSQAVSRWESGGGYPDMELLPAIAHYFHVTIDELFGFSSRREEKIQQILDSANDRIRQNRELDRCVNDLREASAEFPGDTRIQLALVNGLILRGFQHHGARSTIPTQESDGVPDVEFNRKNPDFAEALTIARRILPELSDPGSRAGLIRHMVRLYSIRGEFNKAEALARQQMPLDISRECLLPMTVTGQRKIILQGEALLALAWRYTNEVLSAVTFRRDLRSTPAGIRKLLSAAELYHSLLDDGNCGFGHYALYVLYRNCARFSEEQENRADAEKYRRMCLRHRDAYALLRRQGGVFCYTAPLVAGVTIHAEDLPPADHS